MSPIPKTLAALLAAVLPLVTATFAAPPAVKLHWVNQPAAGVATGVSWGVPWAQGTVPRTTTFALTDAAGQALPVQTWPLAYWPDGSLKWSGFATTTPAGHSGELTRAGQLVCILQNGPATENEDAPPREKHLSIVRQVTVEQSGPVRAVVKLEGYHPGTVSGRDWLPFTVRLYFYSGETSVRLVHSIIYDGDQEQDFVRGLGVQFAVPLREEARNRTVRFAGADGGIWSEPLQPGGGSVEPETGQPFDDGRAPAVFKANAIWDDFKLTQPNPDGFTIVKRTNPKSTWLFAGAGQRAAGLAFVGDLGGGLAISVKNFWQSYPAGLEVSGASQPVVELTAWLWSPDGPQMDMRHYDLVAHTLAASYEDVQPGMSTAYGVSRTSELTLYPAGVGDQAQNRASVGARLVAGGLQTVPREDHVVLGRIPGVGAGGAQ
jgi:hypothetical protein